MELIGRDQELAEVAERVLGGRRLVTVIGPGGIGKTALALVAMDRLQGAFPLGAHLVDLSRVGEPDAVAGALAAQLGFSSFEALLSSPTDQPALVVVDNCEHVSDAAATAVAGLLARCASPRVLATSRSPLDLPDESIVALPPLAVPEPGHGDDDGHGDGDGDGVASSVQLFLDRAHHSGATTDALDGEHVAELCRRLDGVPLALEIAAARTRSLAVGDILRLLDEGIEVLARPRFRGAPRQRSLRAAIDWSRDLLSDDGRATFDRLGVCAGPFTATTAAEVVLGVGAPSAAALDRLDELVDASLLVVDARGREARYRMLETVRAVALAHLEATGDLGPTRDRFVRHVRATAREMLAIGSVRWPAELLHRLLDEFDNIAAAIRVCVTDDDRPDRAFELYTVLFGVIHQAHLDDVVDLGRLVTARWPDVEAPHAADVRAVLASTLLVGGQVDEAVIVASEAAKPTGESPFAPTLVPRLLGFAAWTKGDLDRATALLDEAVAAATTRGLPAIAMESQVLAALVRAERGALDDAIRLLQEVVRWAAASGSTLHELWARTAEGSIISAVHPAAALPAIERTLADAEAVGYPFGVTSSRQMLARCLVRTGRIDEAASTVLVLMDQAGRSAQGDVRVALELAAAVAAAAGRPEAGDLAATAAALPNTSPMRRPAPIVAASARAVPVTDATRLARAMLRHLASGDGRSAPAPPAAEDTGDAVFSLVGEVWHVRYAGTAIQVTTSKGMADLARLLARPGEEIHCIDLTGAAVEQPGTGEMIDATARRRYEERVRDLQAEIDDADAANDLRRAERARVELDALVDHLTAAMGRAGRVRDGAGTAERARSAVAHRVRSTIRRLGALHPPLGRHLEASVSTGLYCSYRPERPVVWRT